MSFWEQVKREWDAACRFAAREENRFSERLVLLSGILFGLSLSITVIHWMPASGSGLQAARELGIISRTVLFCYDKNQEFSAYLVAIFLTLFTAFWVWIFWAERGSRRSVDSFSNSFVLVTDPAGSEVISEQASLSSSETNLAKRTAPSVLLLLVLIALYWSPHFFLRTQYFFHFSFEEGHYYGALQEMLRGARLYRDVFFIYGPLSVYPAYWMMLLFGPHVQWLRVQTFTLDLLAIVLLFLFLRRFTQRAFTPFWGTLLFVVLYFPDWSAPSGGVFRYFSGIISLMLLSRYFSTRKRSWLMAAGLSVALVFFYSQEIGLCALIATVTITAVEALESRRSPRKQAMVHGMMVLGSALAGAAAGFSFFALRGAGKRFWKLLGGIPEKWPWVTSDCLIPI